MLKKLYIIGAAGFGQEVAWIIEQINMKRHEWEIVGFLDDNEKLHGKTLNGYEVLGNCDLLNIVLEEAWVICTIGATSIRREVIKKLQRNRNIRFATIIAPSAIIPNNVSIGEGTIISSGVISSVNVTIGNYVIVNMNCTLGHDTVIKDFVTLRPSADIAGNVLLEETVDVGIGAMVIQNTTVEAAATLGGGAVVVKDVKAAQTVVGVPAKQIKYNS